MLCTDYSNLMVIQIIQKSGKKHVDYLFICIDLIQELSLFENSKIASFKQVHRFVLNSFNSTEAKLAKKRAKEQKLAVSSKKRLYAL